MLDKEYFANNIDVYNALINSSHNPTVQLAKAAASPAASTASTVAVKAIAASTESSKENAAHPKTNL